MLWFTALGASVWQEGIGDIAQRGGILAEVLCVKGAIRRDMIRLKTHSRDGVA